MKKQLFTLCSIIISFCVHAQDESEAFKKAIMDEGYRFGYIILNDSTKLNGLIKPVNVKFKLGNPIKSDLKIVTRDGTQQVLKAFELLSYKTDIHGMVSDGSIFCEIILQGKRVGLYKFQTHGYTPVMGGFGGETQFYISNAGTTGEFYFRKSEGKFMIVKKGGEFRKTFSSFFEDCPDLKDRILKKDLNHNDLEWIFAIYENCK